MKFSLQKNGYWVVVAIVSLVGLVAILAYVANFGTNGISGKGQDWASFANYISGTLGVTAVVGTLFLFAKTVTQQSKLIHQQEVMIQGQAEQISEISRHQRKSEAYVKAEKIFPTLFKGAKEKLSKRMSFFHGSFRGIDVGFGSLPDASLKSFFLNPVSAKLLFELSEKQGATVFISYMIHDQYRLCRFVHECVRDSEDLAGFFFEEMDEYMMIMQCVMAYYGVSENFNKSWGVRPMVRINGYGKDHPAYYWEKIGKQIAKNS